MSRALQQASPPSFVTIFIRTVFLSDTIYIGVLFRYLTPKSKFFNFFNKICAPTNLLLFIEEIGLLRPIRICHILVIIGRCSTVDIKFTYHLSLICQKGLEPCTVLIL